jgi:hypothetical protein
MSHKYNLYLGKAGQQAVMSEFLVRGWNVATPEVDIGDDIFGKNLMIYFSFQDKKILCSEVDMAAYRNNFDDFPIVPH